MYMYICCVQWFELTNQVAGIGSHDQTVSTTVLFPCSDIEKIQAGIGDKVQVFLTYFSTFVAGFVIGFATNWKLALVVSTMLPILSFFAGVIAKVSLVHRPLIHAWVWD